MLFADPISIFAQKIKKAMMRKRLKRKERKAMQRLTLDKWIAVPRNACVELQWFPAPPSIPVGYEESNSTWLGRLLIWEYGQDIIRDHFLDNGNCNERIQLARERYGLEELVKDPDWEVRKAVAEQGYAQEILSKDPIAEVREAVAVWQNRLRREIHSRDMYTRAEAISYCTWKGKREINEIMVWASRTGKQHMHISYISKAE